MREGGTASASPVVRDLPLPASPQQLPGLLPGGFSWVSGWSCWLLNFWGCRPEQSETEAQVRLQMPGVTQAKTSPDGKPGAAACSGLLGAGQSCCKHLGCRSHSWGWHPPPPADRAQGLLQPRPGAPLLPTVGRHGSLTPPPTHQTHTPDYPHRHIALSPHRHTHRCGCTPGTPPHTHTSHPTDTHAGVHTHQTPSPPRDTPHITSQTHKTHAGTRHPSPLTHRQTGRQAHDITHSHSRPVWAPQPQPQPDAGPCPCAGRTGRPGPPRPPARRTRWGAAAPQAPRVRRRGGGGASAGGGARPGPARWDFSPSGGGAAPRTSRDSRSQAHHRIARPCRQLPAAPGSTAGQTLPLHLRSPTMHLLWDPNPPAAPPQSHNAPVVRFPTLPLHLQSHNAPLAGSIPPAAPPQSQSAPVVGSQPSDYTSTVPQCICCGTHSKAEVLEQNKNKWTKPSHTIVHVFPRLTSVFQLFWSCCQVFSPP